MAVPLFIAISGFFLSKKTLDNKIQYVSFLKRQIPKVYLPTLLWSLPLLVISVSSGEDIFKNILKLFLCGFSIYYFIAYIIQCYIALPIIKRIEMKYVYISLIVSSLISMMWVGIYVILKTHYLIPLSLIAYAGPLPCWLMFFMLGVALGQSPNRNYSRLLPVIICVAGYILSVVSSLYTDVGEGIKPTSFVFSFGMILLLFNAKTERSLTITNKFFKAFVWIGNVSFTIYLTHMYIVWFVVEQCTIESWCLRVMVTLSLTCLLIIVLTKVISRQLHKYFGI